MTYLVYAIKYFLEDGMGRPPKDTVSLTLRIEQTMLDDLDELRQKVKNPPTRPEIIRRILTDWLATSDGAPPPEG